MGNNQPYPEEIQYYEQSQINYDSFSQFELYRIDIPNNLVPYYNDWYETRLDRNTRFVRVIDFNAESQGCDACSMSQHLTVYTERLFFLDILSLSYPEAIFFMKECLVTLDQLYDQFGVFRVTPRMVGVNHKGKVKVWCNENFAQNLPVEQNDPYLDQEDVVYDLVDMIQQATEDYRFTRTIQSYAGNLTFSNTIRILESMQAQEGLAVNKIFLNLQEYEDEMYRAIQAKQQRAVETVAKTTYYEVPQQVIYEVPQVTQTYQIIEYPEVYIPPPAPVLNVTPVQYHQILPTSPVHTALPVRPYSDRHNPYSVLKLYRPPTPQPQIQPIPIHQGIQRVNKQQRILAPQKIRTPQMNVVNRPVAERLPVTEIDLKRLEADIRRKEDEIKLKKKLQDNYNQIPQVESMIVFMEEEDKIRNYDRIPAQRNPAFNRQPSMPRIQPRAQPQAPPGRPNTFQKQPMNIKQVNHQSEIFTLF